ncbi:PTS system, glucose-like IIB subunint [Coriobacterium glomerans PW2]|uniref:PTS system, glucose-like IIB subunint n=1 Tax=Coriobacterium glomerans (strain ATCC 49209 / DSM 20642 / JCM 10262 / PW2) TaxID=700015 RepID=F2NA75_CORGP|nr:PTS transporter subunit EIIC [Coriobacterium glomerans]AEB06469.1 PTS system, glucose-like IIB subunint [Coriobacterium glomerans PW2]
MDYRRIATEILHLVGGSSNVVSAAHCATRLRLVVADNSMIDKGAIEEVESVKGVFEAQGQLQIILGTGTVNKVYEEFIELGHLDASSKQETKNAAAEHQNIVMRAIKLLGDIFVPIIPAIVASGLLLGIMSALNFMNSNGFIEIDTNGFVYRIADLVSGTSFTFLQILIGFSAAQAFGANPYLGAVVGMALINPSLQSAYTVASDGVKTLVPVIPGVYSFDWVGYQGHVIPIVIAVGILAATEKRLHRIVPEMFDLFVTPLVSVFVTVLVTLVAVGPIFSWAENAILFVIQALLSLPFGIGATIIGCFYAPTVVTGIHQMYTAIDLGQLAQYGVTHWLPIASAANIAQGGAALAVALKTRSAKIRGLALPSALSAFMGITEPAIFGVNLRFVKPFIAGCIGGGAGALVCALTSLAASGTGVTGIFGILLCLAQPVQYAIMFLVALAVSFAISFALYRDETTSKSSENA